MIKTYRGNFKRINLRGIAPFFCLGMPVPVALFAHSPHFVPGYPLQSLMLQHTFLCPQKNSQKGSKFAPCSPSARVYKRSYVAPLLYGRSTTLRSHFRRPLCAFFFFVFSFGAVPAAAGGSVRGLLLLLVVFFVWHGWFFFFWFLFSSVGFLVARFGWFSRLVRFSVGCSSLARLGWRGGFGCSFRFGFVRLRWWFVRSRSFFVPFGFGFLRSFLRVRSGCVRCSFGGVGPLGCCQSSPSLGVLSWSRVSSWSFAFLRSWSLLRWFRFGFLGFVGSCGWFGGSRSRLVASWRRSSLRLVLPFARWRLVASSLVC